jgi:hypothetical protein
MDPDAPFILAALSIIALTILGVGRMWFYRGTPADPAHKRLRAIEDRLARIEQALDAIAIETERISEGQRFTTRLLTDRMHEAPSAAGADSQ